MSLNHSLTEDDREPLLRAPLVDGDYEEQAEQRPGPFPSSGPQKEAYRDAAFAVLFYLHAVLVAALALGRGIPAVARGAVDVQWVDPATQTPTEDGEDEVGAGKLAAGLMLTLLLGAGLAAAAVATLLRFGESLIRCTLLTTVAWFGLCSIGFFAAGIVAGGAVMLVMAMLSYCYYWLVRKRVEFAGKNLRVACAAVAAMPGTVGAALLLLAVNVLWCLLWGLALLGVATSYGDASVVGPDGVEYAADTCTTYETTGPSPDFSAACTMAGDSCTKCVCGDVTVFADRQCTEYSVNGWVYAAMLLSLYWGCTVITNLVHVTTAGAVGAFWFTRQPTGSPVREAMRRATTTSFGSVCMASFLAALVRVSRLLLDQMRRNRGQLSSFVLAIVDCLLAAVESVVILFNRYALCHCAIYGTDLRSAGRETWALFVRRGWTAIINDSLIDNVLALACAAVAALCALGGFGVAWVLGATGDGGVWVVVLVLSGAVMGYFLAAVAMSVVSSAVATVFVCFAQDHLVFGNTHPDLHLQLLQAWARFHGPIMVHCGYTM